MMTESQERYLREEVGRLKTEAINFAEALHTIIRETDEAETVRVAMSVLVATPTGQNYLTANPIGY